MTEYTRDPVPGDFDHRSLDTCAVHGPNTCHARPKGQLGPFFCVPCALAVLEEKHGGPLSDEEKSTARQRAREGFELLGESASARAELSPKLVAFLRYMADCVEVNRKDELRATE